MADPGADEPDLLLAAWLADVATAAPAQGEPMWQPEGRWLLHAWSEPHRAYHRLQHLAEVLTALDVLRQAGELSADDALTARLAAWYHDAAYDPRAQPGSNEHRSATLARDHLHRLGVPADRVDAVEALVLMTVDHGPDGATGARAPASAVAAFHDADLWILAAPPARHAEYTSQVRQEYAHVPDDLFAQGRAAIIGPLVQRDEVYRTAYARREWTDAARRNVAAELGTT